MSAKERRIQSIKEKIGYVIDDIAKKYRCRAYYIMNYDAYVFIVRFKNERGESAKMLIGKDAHRAKSNRRAAR